MLATLAMFPAAGRAASAGPPAGPFAADRFTVQPGMRTVCIASRNDAATGKGCFDVYAFSNETDAAQDYVIWRFLGRTQPADGHRVERLGLAVRSSLGELVGWDPPEDRDVSATEETPVILDDDRAYSAAGVDTRAATHVFRSLPGTLHPVVDADHFAVSWSAAGPRRPVTMPNAGWPRGDGRGGGHELVERRRCAGRSTIRCLQPGATRLDNAVTAGRYLVVLPRRARCVE